MSDDPAAFLAVQLDKLEATANEVLPRRRWNAGPADALTPADERIWVLDDDYKHNTLVVDERFVLDLVAAHRKILELLEAMDDEGERCNQSMIRELLAQGYGWTPEEAT